MAAIRQAFSKKSRFMSISPLDEYHCISPDVAEIEVTFTDVDGGGARTYQISAIDGAPLPVGVDAMIFDLGDLIDDINNNVWVLCQWWSWLDSNQR